MPGLRGPLRLRRRMPQGPHRPAPDGEEGLNHLCEGYTRFFSHAEPAIAAIAELLRAGRPAADVMATAAGGGREGYARVAEA